MLKRTLLMVALVSLVGVPAMAQEHKATVDVLFGWTFADGVQTDQTIISGDGTAYNRIDPKDSFKWGLGGGALIGPNLEVGFKFSQARSTLVAQGPSKSTDVGPMLLNNYHGYVGYNFGEPDLPARLYFFGGLGATNFGSVNYTRSIGGAASTQSDTQFSTTWGLGVKFFPSASKVGASFGVQFTPSYIKSTAGGMWCDPWWGCYAVGNAHYANQWDLGGGLSLRF